MSSAGVDERLVASVHVGTWTTADNHAAFSTCFAMLAEPEESHMVCVCVCVFAPRLCLIWICLEQSQ